MKKPQREYCQQGHAYAGGNLYISPRGLRQCRLCRRLYNKKHQATACLSENSIRLLIEGLREGKTINNLVRGRRGKQGYIPGLRVVHSMTMVNNTINAYPKLGRIITRLREQNYRAAHAARLIGGVDNPRRLCAAPAILRNDGRDAFEIITRATQHLFEPLRGTVRSDLWTAVAENRLRLSEISARTQEFVRKYYRDEKYAVDSRWGHRSLDAPIGEDGFSLYETIPTNAGWSPVANSTGRHVSARRLT